MVGMEVKLRMHDPTLVKVQEAMDYLIDVLPPDESATLTFTYDELRYIRRLIWADSATTELLFESVKDRKRYEERKKSRRGE